MSAQHPGDNGHGEGIIHSIADVYEAIAFVLSGSDDSVDRGLAQLQTLSSQWSFSRADLVVALTETDVMPLLLRVFDVRPPASDAIQHLTRLFADLAAKPVGCQFLIAFNVPSVVGLLIDKLTVVSDHFTQSDVNAHLNNALLMLGSLASKDAHTQQQLIGDGSFDRILLQSAKTLFVGPLCGLPGPVYDTLAWAARSFCEGSAGRIPYSSLAPLVPHLIWAMMNLMGDAVSDAAFAAVGLFDGARAGVAWEELTCVGAAIPNLAVQILTHPQCGDAAPEPFARILLTVSELPDIGRYGEDIVFVWSAPLISAVACLPRNQLLQESPCYFDILRTLANLAAKPKCAPLLIAQPGALPELLVQTHNQLGLVPPHPDADAVVWRSIAELGCVLVNLAARGGAAAPHLLAWQAPAWAARALCSPLPRGTPEALVAARSAKSAASDVALLLTHQGSLEPDEAYSRGENGPNPYFSAFAAAERMHFVLPRDWAADETSHAARLLSLATTLAGFTEAVHVEYADTAAPLGGGGDDAEGNVHSITDREQRSSRSLNSAFVDAEARLHVRLFSYLFSFICFLALPFVRIRTQLTAHSPENVFTSQLADGNSDDGGGGEGAGSEGGEGN